MSSKTLKANGKKTKSALRGKRKHHAIVYGVVAGVVVAAFASALTIYSGSKQPPEKQKVNANGLICLSKSDKKGGDCLYKLETADSDKKRTLGLSGRDSMPKELGMLFDFERTGKQCMWMKDMKFSLDMLWLNEKKEVIKLVQHISPETFPTTFCSNNAKYVIELNDGAAQAAGLDTGQTLNF